jgi:micrococcal nuclease
MNRIAVLLNFLVLLWFSVTIGYAENQPPIFKKYTLLKVIDGDTILVNDGNKQKLRLIGIDTPEPWFEEKTGKDARRAGVSIESMKKLGRLATEFVRSYLSVYYGEKITVELGAERYDKYGRLLGYLWLPNGKMLNREILRAGYARIMSIPPNTKYYREFLQLEKKAHHSHLGIWKQLKKW